MNKKIKNALNDKMQVKLPENLSAENILAELPKTEENIIEMPKKKLTAKKLIPMVASFAVIIGLLGTYFGLGLGDKNKPTTQTGDICEVVHYSTYDRVYEKFTEIRRNGYKNSVELYMGDMNDGMVTDDAAIEESAPTASPNFNTGNKDFGETNNQEDGVEEGDIVKTDGKYLYIANENKNSVTIVDASGEKMEIASKIDVPNLYNVNEIYLNENKLVIVGRVYRESQEINELKELYPLDYYCGTAWDSFVKVYDITDRKAPELVTEYEQQGSYESSRMIGTTLYNVTTTHINVNTDDYLDDCIPEVTIDGVCQKISADCISVIEETEIPAYTIITTLDIGKDSEPKSQAILGDCSYIYASTKGFFVSEMVWGKYGDVTTSIYRFEYTDKGVNFKCRGKVDGSINNQFSMSFDGEYFRVATTSTDVRVTADGIVSNWTRNGSNNLYVLNDQMQLVGKVENLAKGEHIESVRFVGDMAYVVTFRQTDPLFVIDLSNPKKPTVKGELKIPGFSEYLHPIADGFLVGVGRDGTETGANTDCKVSLFDVSNPYAPIEKSVLKVVGYQYNYCSSLVSQNHKLYVTLSETDFAVPFSVNKNYAVDEYGLLNGDYYIRYRLTDDGLCEVARYALGISSRVMGATYIGDTFYVAVNVNNTNTSYEEPGTYIMSFDLETNEFKEKIQTAEWNFKYAQ